MKYGTFETPHIYFIQWHWHDIVSACPITKSTSTIRDTGNFTLTMLFLVSLVSHQSNINITFIVSVVCMSVFTYCDTCGGGPIMHSIMSSPFVVRRTRTYMLLSS